MSIRRAIPNRVVGDLEASRRFYADFLGFEVVMDEPGFEMFASPSNPTARVTVAAPEAGAQDPHIRRARLSVEVADVDAVHDAAVQRGLRIVYPLTDEPWGIRRFFVEDDDETVVNVAGHIDDLTAERDGPA
jgi:catechol 2,3-dioxygenase-like lactoylglutathione lyase family enzyme